MNKERSQRTVAVTGGGSGMGRVIARRFAGQGDFVYILGRTKSRLLETAEGAKSIESIVCDVTDTTSVSNAIQGITDKHQTIDVLINCAGGMIAINPEADLIEGHKGEAAFVNGEILNISGGQQFGR